MTNTEMINISNEEILNNSILKQITSIKICENLSKKRLLKSNIPCNIINLLRLNHPNIDIINEIKKSYIKEINFELKSHLYYLLINSDQLNKNYINFNEYSNDIEKYYTIYKSINDKIYESLDIDNNVIIFPRKVFMFLEKFLKEENILNYVNINFNNFNNNELIGHIIINKKIKLGHNISNKKIKIDFYFFETPHDFNNKILIIEKNKINININNQLITTVQKNINDTNVTYIYSNYEYDISDANIRLIEINGI